MFKQFLQIIKKQVPKVMVIQVPRKLLKGEYKDIVMIRHPLKHMTRFTNIPCVISSYGDGDESFEWAYSGGGPADFAINILMHFTNGDEVFSRAFYLDFRDEFLAPMSKPGGEIRKEQVFEFITRMQLTGVEELQYVREQLGGVNE